MRIEQTREITYILCILFLKTLITDLFLSYGLETRLYITNSMKHTNISIQQKSHVTISVQAFFISPEKSDLLSV